MPTPRSDSVNIPSGGSVWAGRDNPLTDLAFTAGTLPADMTAGTFAIVTSKSSAVTGLFSAHQGGVYMEDADAIYFFGAESHSYSYGYDNSVFHLDLSTGAVYRHYDASPFLGEFRIDADGIPWADAAKTKPWGQHAFQQLCPVSASEFVLVYPTLSHANYFFGNPPTYTPAYDGSYTVSDYKNALWYYNVNTLSWRVDSDSANSANTAALMGTGYGIVYLPARGTIAGAVAGNWRELNISTLARESSAPAVNGGTYNSYSFALPDGRVVVNAGGVASNTTAFSIVDPTDPASFVNVAKPGSMSAYSFFNTPWFATAAGNVFGLVKDQANNQLRAIYYSPGSDTWTDTGHTLAMSATEVADAQYWFAAAYASAYNVFLFAANTSGQRRVWGYKPAGGV